MRLQKATRCALFAILELARYPDKQISAADIADKYGISANHLAKVLRNLAQSGMIESMRGAGGGYRFCGNAKRISLFHVISMFENICEDEHGRQEAGADSEIGHALRGVIEEIDGITCATLKSITLATMLRTMEHPRTYAATPDAAE